MCTCENSKVSGGREVIPRRKFLITCSQSMIFLRNTKKDVFSVSPKVAISTGTVDPCQIKNKPQYLPDLWQDLRLAIKGVGQLQRRQAWTLWRRRRSLLYVWLAR